MAESLKVAKADQLSPGQARRVKVHGKRLALFNMMATSTPSRTPAPIKAGRCLEARSQVPGES
jgi:hypothetical protein